MNIIAGKHRMGTKVRSKQYEFEIKVSVCVVLVPKVPSFAPPSWRMSIQGDVISDLKICKLRRHFESSESSVQSFITQGTEHQAKLVKLVQNLQEDSWVFLLFMLGICYWFQVCCQGRSETRFKGYEKEVSSVVMGS